MDLDTFYRLWFILAFLLMMGIRFYYQSRVLREKRAIEIRESRLSLLAGIAAALTAIVFGVEYIFFPGAFAFAYALHFPDWLRWLAGFILLAGIALQWAALHHLGKSFHSLVVSKAEHVLVQTGPYRWIRHPIYTSYFLSYIGGGLLAGNWVLALVPAALYSILVAARMGREEALLEELFGETYTAYKHRTGRLVPRIIR